MDGENENPDNLKNISESTEEKTLDVVETALAVASIEDAANDAINTKVYAELVALRVELLDILLALKGELNYLRSNVDGLTDKIAAVFTPAEKPETVNNPVHNVLDTGVQVAEDSVKGTVQTVKKWI